MSQQHALLLSSELCAVGVPSVWAARVLLLWQGDCCGQPRSCGWPLVCWLPGCALCDGCWPRWAEPGHETTGCRASRVPGLLLAHWWVDLGSKLILAGSSVLDLMLACRWVGLVFDMADCEV